MTQSKKLNLFISYSHLDESQINEFIKHSATFSNNGLIELWYDRNILAGKEFQDKIDINLEQADIVCLFLSANFLASNACMKEKKMALELRKTKGISVISIVLSPCLWLHDKEISPLLALPTDGKEVTDFQDANKAWVNVWNGLKKVIDSEIKVKQLKITEQFSIFLQDTELLNKAHSQKEKIVLDDIFVFPDLEKYDDLRNFEKKENSQKIIEDIYNYPKLLIAGENQSGKTTLCKKIYLELRKLNFVPVYIYDKFNPYQGKLTIKISKAFKEQYESVSMDEIETCRIVPILDEFHLAPNKESLIKELLEYGHQVLIVDDIFSLNIKSENLIKSYVHFKINEFIPSLRNQLIKKWITLTDKVNNVSNKINDLYQSLDNKTELINSVLGKAIGSGIMPSYPFFILTIISTYETFEKPLENEITSQGYCYQTLICLYLGKQGVKGDNLDIYINYLTEFAFFFYTEKKNEISTEDYNSFIKLYSSKFNLHIKGEILLDKLLKTNIILLDSCNNYSFRYQYLYYFFVARYLAENVDTNKAEIDKIINNLHNDENAYIAIFISHHSKHTYVIDQIVNNANNLFKNHLPATLNKKELHFFDGQADTIVKAILPPSNETPEQVRAKRLARQDFEEASKNKNDKKSNINFDDEEFSLELRRSVKTVEVMGLIIKNRAGSLEKAKLESIFEKAMKVHFRILTSFFEIIKLEKNQQEIVEYISTRLNKIIEKTAQERINEGKKARSISKEELEKFSKKIFWNTNFFVIYGFINKVVHSLGSDKLIEIVKKVCDDENTPASFLVKHGILMWYKKNLQTDTIAEEISKDNFSYIANRLIEFMVVNHCSIHPQGYKEKQKIELKLKIPSKKLLIEQRIAKEDK